MEMTPKVEPRIFTTSAGGSDGFHGWSNFGDDAVDGLVNEGGVLVEELVDSVDVPKCLLLVSTRVWFEGVWYIYRTVGSTHTRRLRWCGMLGWYRW